MRKRRDCKWQPQLGCQGQVAVAIGTLAGPTAWWPTFLDGLQTCRIRIRVATVVGNNVNKAINMAERSTENNNSRIREPEKGK